MNMDRLLRASFALPLILSIGACLYLITLGIYRLYLHPLAKFPGPKLAALSRWYEFYYEVIRQGNFTLHIPDLHRKYGPIIRITPDELHVEDSDYWEYLYSRTARLDKYEWMSGRMGSEGMLFTTASADLHKLRRGVLNPFFSKRSIVNYQPFIREKTQSLCMKLEQYKEDGRILAINRAFSAFAGDVICQYCFGLCYNHLESPNFEESFHDAFMAVSAFGHTTLQFPWVTPLLNMLPDSIVDMMNPALHMLLVLKKDFQRIISKIANSEHKKAEHATVFHEVLNSDLPEGEKGLKRLGDEAFGILGAGTETTAWALTLATFHLINQPATLERLQVELKAAIPDPTAPLDWLHLEELPYLSACIKEAVRLSYGVTSRSPRIAPQNRLFKYKSWDIPSGTPISMTIVDIHNDESVFPDAQSFTPERWLDNPRTKDGSSLDRYFVSFGKDARSCLGVNLAYAELFLVVAAIFRRFTFELYETDVSDVRMAHDFFIPSPKLDSKGVRVKVVGTNK